MPVLSIPAFLCDLGALSGRKVPTPHWTTRETKKGTFIMQGVLLQRRKTVTPTRLAAGLGSKKPTLRWIWLILPIRP